MNKPGICQSELTAEGKLRLSETWIAEHPEIAAANRASREDMRQQLAREADHLYGDYKAALRLWNIAEEKYRRFCQGDE